MGEETLAPMEEPRPTPRVEEYLEAIYNMLSEGMTVIAARLAARLDLTPPTVAATLQRMSRDGLIVLNDRKEIGLTPKGQELAEKIIRRHRLTERFLVDVLGLDWVTAHEEATHIEHGITPRLEERLAAVLGYPKTCPHGNPIPGMGWQPAPGEFRLDKATEGQEIVVERITEEAEWDPRLLEYLQQHGVIPGARFTVVQVAPYAGTLTLRTPEGREVTVGLKAAARICVYPAGSTSPAEPGASS
jgi:DtxR family Mn-dependent transcriptional regulator